ncbi:MAG: hypothetical protein K2X31_09835 [Sphingopyxis sp.]|nr:hypothetical protein [Sphingopyxis sp.]
MVLLTAAAAFTEPEAWSWPVERWVTKLAYKLPRGEPCRELLALIA